MKFNTILRGFINESNALIKIAVKVDPGVGSSKDYRKFDGYEGFILKEIGDGDCEVAIENENFDIAKIPLSCISIIDIPNADVFNIFKNVCLSELDSRNLLTNEKINKLSQCDSLDFLEQYLKEDGLNDADIKDLYKIAIRRTVVGEAVNWEKIARGAYKIGRAIALPDQVAGEYFKQGINWLTGKDEKQTPQGSKSGKVAQNLPMPLPQFTPINLNTVASISIPKDDTFIKVILNNPKIFTHYRDKTGLYLYNKQTGDVFKLSGDKSNPKNNYEVRGYNVKNRGSDTTLLTSYIQKILPKENAPNYTIFHTAYITQPPRQNP